MLKTWMLSIVLVTLAFVTGCTTAPPPAPDLVVATGGTTAGSDPACGNDGVTVDPYGCVQGLSCQDVTMGLVAGFTYCSCPLTARPPTCDPVVPTSCAGYPGTACTTLPEVGDFCTQTCTLHAPVATGGVLVATGGVLANGGMMGETGGVVATDMCVNDPAAMDGSTCAPGLLCSAAANFCACPKTGAPPPCVAGGTDCAAYPGTACVDVPGLGTTGCLLGCTPPGQAPVGCPDGMVCDATTGQGLCIVAGGLPFPPACTEGGSECSAYAGSACIGGFCVKQCTPTQ